MNEPYLGQTTDMVLGQEFLTWLWFRSETQPMGFKDKEGVPFSMNLEQRIVVQGGEGDSLETASVSGSLYSPLRSQNNLDASGAVGDHPRQLLCYPSGSGDADGHADDAEPPCGGSGAGSS